MKLKIKDLKLISFFFLLILIITCCYRRISTNDEETPNRFVLDFTDAIKNPKESLKLSELVDSITYIPLETNSLNLLGDMQLMSFQPQYIFYSNYCFDWNGKFIGQIGKVGQGPCEDVYAKVAKILYHNGFFYADASKIIQYNKKGECTGKERSWYLPKEDPNLPFGNHLTNKICLSSAQENLILFNYPDTLYFLDTDFKIVSKRFIMPWNSSKIAHTTTGVYDKCISYYRDTTLFYNFYTDTVFTVNSNGLTCRYIIKLDDGIKVSRKLLYEYTDLLGDAFKYWEKGALDKCRMVELVDHKYRIMGVYETNLYIFLLIDELIAFRKLRGIPQREPMVGIYSKEDGSINVVKYIENDLGGLKNFIPLWGACNEKLINIIWPYQIKEFIQEEQAKGQDIDENLIDLMNKIHEDDNPILIIAHLKQQ